MTTSLEAKAASFFGGTLNLISSSFLVVIIAILIELFYIGYLVKSSRDFQRLTYQRTLYIEQYVRRNAANNTSRQTHIRADDVDTVRPAIPKARVVERPRDEDIAPRGARMSMGVKRERNADGIRHDRELRDDTGSSTSPE